MTEPESEPETEEIRQKIVEEIRDADGAFVILADERPDVEDGQVEITRAAFVDDENMEGGERDRQAMFARMNVAALEEASENLGMGQIVPIPKVFPSDESGGGVALGFNIPGVPAKEMPEGDDDDSVRGMYR